MLAEHGTADGYVFTAAGGGPIRHRNFMRRHFRPAVTDAGLPEGLRFHDLRHTCAALLIASGAHLQEVKEHLGDASIRTTSDRYGHVFPEARDRLRDRLDVTFAESPADLPRTLEFGREDRGSEKPRFTGADDGIRTRDPHLGKVMLYH